MQTSRALRALVFAAAAVWAVPASAHAGGAEAAPIVGGAAGFIAGVVVGTIPRTWRKNAVLVALALLLSPITYLIFKEPSFPSNTSAAIAGWLSLGFAFFLVPAGLLGLAGYACTSWVKRAIQFHRKHGQQVDVRNG